MGAGCAEEKAVRIPEHKQDSGPDSAPNVKVQYRGVDYVQTAPYLFGSESEVELTPLPAAGDAFLNWDEYLSGAVAPGKVVMDDNKSVTAVFAPAKTLTTIVQGEGTVLINRADGGPVHALGNGQYALPEGAEISLSVEPSIGWGFLYWDLNPLPEILEKDRTNPLPLTMNDDITITARFMPQHHTGDYNPADFVISLDELLRVIQFYNDNGYHCEYIIESEGEGEKAEDPDGYRTGTDTLYQDCMPHSSDYNPQDWKVDLSEVLRFIQFFNFYIPEPNLRKSYHFCPFNDPPTEDLYCTGNP